MAQEDIYINVRRKIIFTQASSWKRILAFLLDYLILNSFILFPFNKLIAKLYPTDSLNDMMALIINGHTNVVPIVLVSVIMSVVALLYFIILEMALSQSIGKMAMGILIVDVHSNLKDAAKFKAGLWRTFIRNLSLVTIFVMPLIFMGDCIYAYFNKDGQRFCEMLSNTKTVELTAI